MLDVLIVGAGPSGLAAAIAAQRAGLEAFVIEKGVLVNSLQRFPTDMVYFTTPELLEIGGLPFVSPHEKPTRMEALRYYRRVADTFRLPIAFQEAVTGITRESDGTFRVTSRPAHGSPRVHQARMVVVATGAYDVPNYLGVPGEDLPHVSHFYREAHSYYRQRVVVVGAKNSAADAALELYRNGATVLLVHRGSELGAGIKYWVRPDLENRIKEGSIVARFDTRVVEITPTDVVLEGPEGVSRERADSVLLMTGYRSDTTLLRQAGAEVNDPFCAPVHDADTLESTVPNLFVIGACVAGSQSGRIFIENGRFHGEGVIAEIVTRLRGAQATA